MFQSKVSYYLLFLTIAYNPHKLYLTWLYENTELRKEKNTKYFPRYSFSLGELLLGSPS